MKQFISNLHLFNKFVKGMFGLMALNLLAIAGVYVFNSCQNNKEEDLDKRAATNFLSVLESNKKLIGSIDVNAFSSIQTLNTQTLKKSISTNYNNQFVNAQTIYLSLSEPVTADIQSKAGKIESIQGLSNFINQTNAIIQYKPDPMVPAGSELMAKIPVYSIYESLTPLIGAAKDYLKSKGFTDQDIQEMLVENNAQEVELVLFVMVLSRTEAEEYQANTIRSENMLNNLPFFFANSVSAQTVVGYQDYVRCALSAIGADILFSLAFSSATTWTVPLLKKAFTTVAKRALGPIGVAISVVSFGLCIGQAYGVVF